LLIYFNLIVERLDATIGPQNTIKHVDNTQHGGSRDAYHGSVDRSNNETKIGNQAKFGGTHNTTNSKF